MAVEAYQNVIIENLHANAEAVDAEVFPGRKFFLGDPTRVYFDGRFLKVGEIEGCAEQRKKLREQLEWIQARRSAAEEECGDFDIGMVGCPGGYFLDEGRVVVRLELRVFFESDEVAVVALVFAEGPVKVQSDGCTLALCEEVVAEFGCVPIGT